MPQYRVTSPSGRVYDIEAPEGASEAQVFAMVRKQEGADPVKGPDIVEPSLAGDVLNTVGRTYAGVEQGAAKVFDNAADKLESGYNMTLGKLLGQSHSADTPAFSNISAQLGEGNKAGQVGGEILGTALLTKRVPGGAFGQGAASAGIMSEAQDPVSYGIDMLTGGVGGHLIGKATSGLSAMIAPKISDAARYLYNKGIRMTPGQIIPAFQKTEEKLMSRPFIGDRIAEGRARSYSDFNRASVQETLSPAGLQLPANLEGRAAVKWAGDNLSREYESLVPRLSLRPDSQLANEITAVRTTVDNGNLSPAAITQFERIVQNQVMPRLNGNAPLTGQQFRAIEKNLSAQIARFGKSKEPDNQAMADAFKQMQDAFQAALQRSNPRHADKLRGLNEGWSNLVRVEGAGSGARFGLFSPGQLWNSVKSADSSTRHRGVARGQAVMQDMADAAVDVLPSDYPDSGTSGRNQMNMLDPRYWVGFGQSLLYGPGVQQTVTKAAMTPRPQSAQTIADLLRHAPAAQIGAAATAPLVPTR